MKKIISIKDGVITGFDDEIQVKGLELETISRKRVSHIVPKNMVLRFGFRALRIIFGECGRVARWTRRWDCVWVVIIELVNYGPFTDRVKAIQFEKEKVRSLGLGLAD